MVKGLPVRKSAFILLLTLLVAIAPTARAATLTIPTPTDQSAVVGTLFTLQITASGGTGGNVYSLTSGTLPSGLTFNTTSGLISGTPTASESATITVRVTDSSAATATTAAFKIFTGWVVTTFAGTAGVSAESGIGGAATSASFDVHGLSIRSDGVVYFSDPTTSKIHQINLGGVVSNVLTASSLPVGIIARDNGDIFFNTYNGTNRIQKYTASTQTTAVWSSVSTNFSSPRGAISDSAGNIYVADSSNNQIKKIATDGSVSIIAGTSAAGGTGDDGAATAATLNYPGDVAVDKNGNVYFSEINSSKIRKISADGTMRKVLGDGTATTSGDGGLAINAKTSGVWGIAVDGADNLFFMEKNGNSIRRIDATTGIVTRVAGTGVAGVNGSPVNGISSLATFSTLLMVGRFDRQGNLYIIDYSNKLIRKIAGIGVPFSNPVATAALSTGTSWKKGIAQNISATVSAVGKVTFYANQKKIPGCIGKSASGLAPITVTCTWRPSSSGSFEISAAFMPTDNSLSSISSRATITVARRSNFR